MTDLRGLLRALAEGGVAFIVVGGVAATIHGSARLTQDVDVVYLRTPDNLRRLVSALEPYHPYLRGVPPGLPFQLDVPTVDAGLNFTLRTDLGDLDLLGEVTAGGRYEALVDDSLEVAVFGVTIRCVGLQALLRMKRAVGRPKDLEVVGELEHLLEHPEYDEGD